LELPLLARLEAIFHHVIQLVIYIIISDKEMGFSYTRRAGWRVICARRMGMICRRFLVLGVGRRVPGVRRVRTSHLILGVDSIF
jgi:hypothetical protein